MRMFHRWKSDDTNEARKVILHLLDRPHSGLAKPSEALTLADDYLRLYPKDSHVREIRERWEKP
jgi:hypothetical protein